MKKTRGAALTLCLAIAGWGGVARAQEDAASIKKRGDVAIEAGRAAEALSAYRESYALSQDPALLYNLGRAYKLLGEDAEALASLEEFERKATPELRRLVPGLSKQIADLRAKVTTLVLACDVVGATVRLRDRTLGTCPMPPAVRVNAGKAHLEVTAEGRFPFVRDTDLPGGGVASFDVHLGSKATSGILAVRANVPHARVTVDGQVLGIAPVETIVAAGSHAIDVQRDGYKSTHTGAVLAAGERRTVDVSLESETGLLGRWWFWTAVGVVVAGGVALVVVLNTEKDPDRGTVAPGVVVSDLRGAGFRF